MSGVVWAVIRREYLQRVRSRWFVLATVAAPILLIGLGTVSVLLATGGEQASRTVVVLDRTDLMRRLQAAGVTAAAVIRQREMFDDPHLAARGYFQSVPHPEAGTHPLAGPAYRMSRTPVGIRTPAPTLGEHNEYVYREILGLSEDEYRELLAAGITGDTYADSAT